MIKLFTSEEIDLIVSSFEKENWLKPRATFENYWQEQQAGERLVWLAFKDTQLAGYVTLKKQSSYDSFLKQNIPEIKDLNVLPSCRGCGIGSQLLQTAEQAAFEINRTIGLGVGLYEGYGTAHKMYIARGYIPDGLGITSHNGRVNYGEYVPLDDALILWFTKKLD